MELENQTKHHLTSHSSQLQLVSEVCQVALEHIWLRSVYMKFSHTEARSAVLRPTTSKTVCLNLFPLILPNLLRLYWNQNSCHQENETLINKRAVCCSDTKHNKESRTKTLKHQTDRNSLPVRDETCNALEELLCLDVYSWTPDKEKYFAATCKCIWRNRTSVLYGHRRPHFIPHATNKAVVDVTRTSCSVKICE